MNKIRCQWVSEDLIYIEYHDKEWGKPVYDDEKLFEFLMLETFQAGLSWITVLKKRENFRKAFDDFDFNLIANYTIEKLETLKNDKGIIRNKLKINATVINAKAFIKIQEEYGTFSKYIWGFVNGQTIENNFKSNDEIPANTPLSDMISKDLKKRGFKFVGSTIIYAFMQAIGIVNDHIVDCFCHQLIRDKNK